MNNAYLNQCISFINSQTVVPAGRPAAMQVRRAVTISRQTGCGGLIVAEKLAKFLQARAPREDVAWTVFDRKLMDKVLADHHLPQYLAKFLPEDRMSRIEDTLADIFGVHPTAETMVQQTAETILQLAELGNAILIGRAGNIVTAKLPNVLHVRLVASLEDRIARICRDYGNTPAGARKFCLEEDQARARYVKTYFKADIADPLLYHLVLNTSRMDYDHVAQLIGEAMLRQVV